MKLVLTTPNDKPLYLWVEDFALAVADAYTYHPDARTIIYTLSTTFAVKETPDEIWKYAIEADKQERET